MEQGCRGDGVKKSILYWQMGEAVASYLALAQFRARRRIFSTALSISWVVSITK